MNNKLEWKLMNRPNSVIEIAKKFSNEAENSVKPLQAGHKKRSRTVSHLNRSFSKETISTPLIEALKIPLGIQGMHVSAPIPIQEKIKSDGDRERRCTPEKTDDTMQHNEQASPQFNMEKDEQDGGPGDWEEKYKRLMSQYKELKEENMHLWEFINKVEERKKDRLGLKLLLRPAIDFLQKRNILKNESCFNAEIEEVETHEAYNCVPKVVVECVKILENNEEHLKTVGLYRVSGDHKTIQSFRYNINLGQYEKLRNFTGSPHEITGIMKLFIRELKKPLIPSKLFNTYIPSDLNLKDTSVNVHDKIYCLIDDMRKKTEFKRNYATLKYLIKHLRKVASFQDQNEMGSENLAVVMGPCICYETEISPQNLLLISMAQNRCIQYMIDNYKDLFKQESKPGESVFY